jgi:hypothetical protein
LREARGFHAGRGVGVASAQRAEGGRRDEAGSRRVAARLLDGASSLEYVQGMGDVVNLNRFRKRKAKEDRQKRAEINRRVHGRTKAERARDELQKKQLTKAVDGAKLDGANASVAAEGSSEESDEEQEE